jgi:hypothetical protein
MGGIPRGEAGNDPRRRVLFYQKKVAVVSEAILGALADLVELERDSGHGISF